MNDDNVFFDPHGEGIDKLLYQSLKKDERPLSRLVYIALSDLSIVQGFDPFRSSNTDGDSGFINGDGI